MRGKSTKSDTTPQIVLAWFATLFFVFGAWASPAADAYHGCFITKTADVRNGKTFEISYGGSTFHERYAKEQGERMFKKLFRRKETKRGSLQAYAYALDSGNTIALPAILERYQLDANRSLLRQDQTIKVKKLINPTLFSGPVEGGLKLGMALTSYSEDVSERLLGFVEQIESSLPSILTEPMAKEVVAKAVAAFSRKSGGLELTVDLNEQDLVGIDQIVFVTSSHKPEVDESVWKREMGCYVSMESALTMLSDQNAAYATFNVEVDDAHPDCLLSNFDSRSKEKCSAVANFLDDWIHNRWDDRSREITWQLNFGGEATGSLSDLYDSIKIFYRKGRYRGEAADRWSALATMRREIGGHLGCLIDVQIYFTITYRDSSPIVQKVEVFEDRDDDKLLMLGKYPPSVKPDQPPGTWPDRCHPLESAG